MNGLIDKRKKERTSMFETHKVLGLNTLHQREIYMTYLHSYNLPREYRKLQGKCLFYIS